MNLPSNAARRSRYLARSASLTPLEGGDRLPQLADAVLLPRARPPAARARRQRASCAAERRTGQARRRRRCSARRGPGPKPLLLWPPEPPEQTRSGPCRMLRRPFPDGRAADRTCPDQDGIETRIPPFPSDERRLSKNTPTATHADDADGSQAPSLGPTRPGMHTRPSPPPRPTTPLSPNVSTPVRLAHPFFHDCFLIIYVTVTFRARNPIENAALSDPKFTPSRPTKHDHAHHAKHTQTEIKSVQPAIQFLKFT